MMTIHAACSLCGDTVALPVRPLAVHPAGCTYTTTTVLTVDTSLLDAHNAAHHPERPEDSDA